MLLEHLTSKKQGEKMSKKLREKTMVGMEPAFQDMCRVDRIS